MLMIEMFDGNHYRVNTDDSNLIGFRVMCLANTIYNVEQTRFTKYRFDPFDIDRTVEFFTRMNRIPHVISVDMIKAIYKDV